MSRILLVDDDPCILIVFGEALFGAGHHVDTAETFKAGDSLLSSHRYDALVTDGLLPDGQGTMLATKAGELGIPALLMTGYLHGLSQTYPSIDFSRYSTLEKPVSPDDFLETVEGLLAGS